jgi:hypothetical protein
MKPESITVSLGTHTAAASFLRSEDCGYSAGRLLLDLPCGDTMSIRKDGRKWIETRIQNGIARSPATIHETKQEALKSAAMEFLAESIQVASV